MIRKWFWRVQGWFRLAQGYCPVCSSSPPKPDCWVCQGSYEYGPKMTPGLLATWRQRFDDLR